MSTTNEIIETAEQKTALASHDIPDSSTSVLMDIAKVEHMMTLAKIFAQSSIVPEHYRGNEANVFVMLQKAIQLDIDPLAFLQSSYVIHGKPAIEAKLAIALLERSGKIVGPIEYTLEGTGDDRKCTATVIDSRTGEPVSASVSIAEAKQAGWFAKNGSPWKTMPDVMLRWRSATYLCRFNYPSVLLGLTTKEEEEDNIIDARSVLPRNGSGDPTELISNHLSRVTTDNAEVAPKKKAAKKRRSRKKKEPETATPEQDAEQQETPAEESSAQEEQPPLPVRFANYIAGLSTMDEVDNAYEIALSRAADEEEANHLKEIFKARIDAIVKAEADG